MRPRRLGTFVLGLGLLLVAAGAFVVSGLPPRGQVRSLARLNPGSTGVMRERAEEARKAGRRPRRDQAWVPLPRISRSLIEAVLVAEDIRFFGHDGIDWEALKESVERDLKEQRFARGGSTITQQLAKNLFFSTCKSPVRKLREAIVARWLEEDLSKRRILELYLNVIEWGDGIYGCEAAARHYFDESAADLDAQQAAGLAAMIPNPRRINPTGDAALYSRAQKRILWLMARAGYVKQVVGGMGAEPPPAEDAE